MMMRATIVILAAALVSVACGAGPAAASAHCRPAGSQTMASDRQARVYKLHGTVYGCDRRTGKLSRMGSTSIFRPGEPQIDHVALAGMVVAYGSQVHGVDTGSASVSVRRLSDGKLLQSLAAITGSVGPESVQSIDALVVERTGNVAWIATVTSIIGRGSDMEVHGNRLLLDSGSGIVASSLRLRGSTVSWRHGSTTKSATLYAPAATS